MPLTVETCFCVVQSASVSTRVSSTAKATSGRTAVPMTVNVPTLPSDTTSATTSQSPLFTYTFLQVFHNNLPVL